MQVLMRKGPKMKERAVREVPEPAELVAELIIPYLVHQKDSYSVMVIAVRVAIVIEAKT